MSAGMLGTLWLSDVQGPMDDLQKKLASGDGNKWLTELKKFNKKLATWEWKPEHPPLLTRPSSFAVSALREPLDLRDVFRDNGKGIHCWSGFFHVAEDFLVTLQPQDTGLTPFIQYDVDWGKKWDPYRIHEIKEGLPPDPEVKLWHIVALLKRQWNGEKGPLLCNGCRNVFYFGDYAIHVHRDSCGSKRKIWYLEATHPNSGDWGTVGRVFAPLKMY